MQEYIPLTGRFPFDSLLFLPLRGASPFQGNISLPIYNGIPPVRATSPSLFIGTPLSGEPLHPYLLGPPCQGSFTLPIYWDPHVIDLGHCVKTCLFWQVGLWDIAWGQLNIHNNLRLNPWTPIHPAEKVHESSWKFMKYDENMPQFFMKYHEDSWTF